MPIGRPSHQGGDFGSLLKSQVGDVDDDVELLDSQAVGVGSWSYIYAETGGCGNKAVDSIPLHWLWRTRQPWAESIRRSCSQPCELSTSPWTPRNVRQTAICTIAYST
jgi:hypothetical protein